MKETKVKEERKYRKERGTNNNKKEVKVEEDERKTWTTRIHTWKRRKNKIIKMCKWREKRKIWEVYVEGQKKKQKQEEREREHEGIDTEGEEEIQKQADSI